MVEFSYLTMHHKFHKTLSRTTTCSVNVVLGVLGGFVVLNWAPVSEPAFLDSQISRFWILAISLFQHIVFEKYVGEMSRKNNKGVPDSPWTIWRVMRAIFSTLQFSFPGNHEHEKI